MVLSPHYCVLIPLFSDELLQVVHGEKQRVHCKYTIHFIHVHTYYIGMQKMIEIMINLCMNPKFANVLQNP